MFGSGLGYCVVISIIRWVDVVYVVLERVKVYIVWNGIFCLLSKMSLLGICGLSKFFSVLLCGRECVEKGS